MICTFCNYDKLPYTVSECFKCFEKVGTEKLGILNTSQEYALKRYRSLLLEQNRTEQAEQLTNVILNHKIIKSKCDTDVYLKVKKLLLK